MFQVINPQTEKDFERYFYLRWKLFRKPWHLPQGSEKDDDESHGYHRMIVDNDDQPIAAGRLHLSSSGEGHIFYLAVEEAYRRRRLGTLLVMALEEIARQQGVKRLILHAHEGTDEFYVKCGYRAIGELLTSMGCIRYQQMQKNLYETDIIIRDAKWCQELQQSWHDNIPLSQVMGIRIHQYTGQIFETRAAIDPNLNLHGTMFAGSIYSLATLTGWGLLHLWLKDEYQQASIVLADANIHYHKPLLSAPGAIARMSDIEGDLQPLSQGNKTRVTVQVEVRDHDVLVAEFIGIYALLP